MSKSDAFHPATGSLEPPSIKTAQELEEAQQFFTIQPSRPIDMTVCDDRLVIALPAPVNTDQDWSAILQRLKQRLSNPESSWETIAAVDLVVENRLIDQRQFQLIAKLLSTAKLTLDRIHTSRRQTAVAAVTAGYSVEQTMPTILAEKLKSAKLTNLKFPQVESTQELEKPLFLSKTIRSGSEIRHHGHVVLVGDLNPGGTIVADGDILVWGRLKGVAHAGANGNRSSCIMALQMEPTQLRIADKVARAPATQPEDFFPEVAHIAANGIRITRAREFSRLN